VDEVLEVDLTSVEFMAEKAPAGTTGKLGGPAGATVFVVSALPNFIHEYPVEGGPLNGE